MISDKRQFRFRLFIAIAILLSFYILSNGYHWAVVWKYPACYYFPKYSFHVYDSETQKPLQGVIALCGHEFDTIFSSEDIVAQLLDYFGLHLYLPYQHIYNKVTGSSMSWNNSYLIHLSESESDANGLITIAAYGPVHRPRNHYFYNSHSPIVYLIKEGYCIENMQKAQQIGDTPWIYIPPWNKQSIFMQKQFSVPENIQLPALIVISRMRGFYLGMKEPESLVPKALNILRKMEEKASND